MKELASVRQDYDHAHYALRSDVEEVLVKTEEVKKSGDSAALARWKEKRLEEVRERDKVRFQAASITETILMAADLSELSI